MTDIARLAHAIAADLHRIDDELRWAHTDGWWPEHTDPDRPRGLTPTGNDGTPRKLPAWQARDIGIGNNRSRHAYTQAVPLIAICELRCALALSALGQRTRQPVLIRPTAAMHPHVHRRAIAGTLAALRLVEADWPNADRPQQRAARRHLTGNRKPPTARAAADVAVRILVNALARGGTAGHATGEPLCRICGIRPRAARAGGRCSTCARWRERNGYERPTSIDAEAVGEARKAAARRQARGDGWGAA